MKRFVVAAVFLAAATGALLAADLPPAPAQAPARYAPPVIAPVYNWAGIYLGINAGYGFASGDRTATLTGNTKIPGGGGTATGNGNLNGFVGGGQVGANWQWDAWVLGIEGDFQGTTQSKTESLACGGCGLSEQVKIPWFATVRARVGVAVDRVLVYGTGGVAFMDVSDKLTVPNGTLVNTSDTKTGWTAGAGVEVAFTENWIARIEYLFVEAKPSVTGTVPASLGGGTITESATIKDSVVRVGVNFKFRPY
jgi:outer membrane immunogenic protein